MCQKFTTVLNNRFIEAYPAKLSPHTYITWGQQSLSFTASVYSNSVSVLPRLVLNSVPDKELIFTHIKTWRRWVSFIVSVAMDRESSTHNWNAERFQTSVHRYLYLRASIRSNIRGYALTISASKTWDVSMNTVPIASKRNLKVAKTIRRIFYWPREGIVKMGVRAAPNLPAR